MRFPSSFFVLEALIARRTCDRVLASYGVARLMDDQIAEQVGLPRRE